MSCIKSRLLPAFAAVILCHVVSLAQVQPGSQPAAPREIHGQVRLTEGGAPAQNVLVRLESYESGGPLSEAFTDRSGKFRFSSLSPAQYSVKVHQSGFLDTQQSVDLQTASSGYVILQLTSDTSRSRSVSSAETVDANVPQAAQREFDKGVAALAGGGKEKTAEASRHFEKAVAIYPHFVQARLKLGTAYMDIQEWDKAEGMLLATVAIDPKAANALFALGEVYLQRDKTQDAERVLLQGLQIEDRSFLGHLNLARVYWNRAQTLKVLDQAKPALEKSYAEVKRALQLNPNLAGAHLLKGNLLLRGARPAEALTEFDEYLRLEPKGQLADETRALVEKIRKTMAHQSGSRLR